MERLLTALVAAFLICLMIGPFVIPLLRAFKFGQNIRDDGPQSHLKKAGTPTMGGLIMLSGIIGGTLLAAERPISPEIALLLLFLVGFALIGFLDDFIKIVKKRSLGLRAYQKFLAQVMLSIVFAWVAVNYLGRGTDIAIPFTYLRIDLGHWYYLFAIVVVLATTNAVNFTDGLDGLASGCVFTTSIAYSVIALMAITQGVGILTHDFDLGVYAVALAGACLGFLRFNHHPAQVFMGDTGSLALGGALASLAILTKTELLLVLMGGIYVLEVLSVIIQVASFKIRGKRVFKMATLHHHFELVGWSETRVVYTFWTVCAALGAIGVISYTAMLR